MRPVTSDREVRPQVYSLSSRRPLRQFPFGTCTEVPPTPRSRKVSRRRVHKARRPGPRSRNRGTPRLLGRGPRYFRLGKRLVETVRQLPDLIITLNEDRIRSTPQRTTSTVLLTSIRTPLSCPSSGTVLTLETRPRARTRPSPDNSWVSTRGLPAPGVFDLSEDLKWEAGGLY